MKDLTLQISEDRFVAASASVVRDDVLLSLGAGLESWGLIA
jgi:hypothetical protein